MISGRPRALSLVAVIGLAALPAFTAPASAAAPRQALAEIKVTPLQSNSPQELFGVSFPDATTGYAVGVDGTILATTDGGTAWGPQPAPVPGRDDGVKETLRGVSFPDRLHGHAVSDDGTILETSDGGATWVIQPAPAPTIRVGDQVIGWSFSAVSFPDPLTGFVVGGPGILSTTDGGASWKVFGEPRYGNLMGISSVDPMHSQAVGWSGHAENGIPFVTVATDDGGATWQPRVGQFRSGIDSLNFNAVSFSDPLHGHAVGDEGRIVATSDGGRTWTLQRSGTVETLNGVSFVDARRGVAVGTVTFPTGKQEALVFATDDGGVSWVSRIVAGTDRLWDVAFGGRDNAYAVGCRSTRADADPTPHCVDGALVRIQFFPPAKASRGSGGPSYLLVGIIGLAVAGMAVAILLVRRRPA